MRPETAALVIHDLKNALGALEAELGLLAASTAPPEAGMAAAHGHDPERARRSHRQCSELRQRFVQFLAVYGSGETMQAHCQDESPQSLLDAVARDHLAAAAGHSVITVIDEATPAFWYFDRRLVRMALDAALHNALRFTSSKVSLSARADSGYLVFQVLDDGPGLGAVDPSTDSTGLGTTLCDAVARAHSSGARTGKATLVNAPAGGACFELWLA